MKLIASLSIIFCFYILSQYVPSVYADVTKKEPKTLAEALKVYGTPFIDDYRARYVASQGSIALAMIMEHNCSNFPNSQPYKIPCTRNDIENIINLAKYGDGASLELAFYFIDDRDLFEEYLKSVANKGIVEGLIQYGNIVGRNNFALGKKYLEKAKLSGNIKAYWAFSGFYSHHKMVGEYCAIMDEGYKKFGFEFVALGLLISKPMSQPSIDSQYPQICSGKTADEFLDEINTYESELVKALRYLYNKRNEQAKNIFQKIYDRTDDKNLKQNAGFCLGAMYYSGTAVKMDKAYGLALMKDAVNAGYVMTLQIPEIQMMPNKYKMINPYNRYCDTMLSNSRGFL